MSLTFWDTRRGHELADTLIYYLPRLTEKKGNQYVRRVSLSSMESVIVEEIENGGRYINHQAIGDEVVIIFEEK